MPKKCCVIWSLFLTLHPADCRSSCGQPWDCKGRPKDGSVYQKVATSRVNPAAFAASCHVPQHKKNRCRPFHIREAGPSATSSRLSVKTEPTRYRQRLQSTSSTAPLYGDGDSYFRRAEGEHDRQRRNRVNGVSWSGSGGAAVSNVSKIRSRFFTMSGRDAVGSASVTRVDAARLESEELENRSEASASQGHIMSAGTKPVRSDISATIDRGSLPEAEAKDNAHSGVRRHGTVKQSTNNSDTESMRHPTVTTAEAAVVKSQRQEGKERTHEPNDSPAVDNNIGRTPGAVTLPGMATGHVSSEVQAQKSGTESGFGSRGWYSPAQVEASKSLFSWQGKMSKNAIPKEAGTATLQFRDSDDSTEEEAKADDWSNRRRLVEKWYEYDEVWSSMRKEAKAAAEKEPLLVSFIYSTILNQKTLEAAVAFHLANKLAGPNMLSTQVQALVRECFAEVGDEFRRQLRRDIIAVRERDPACESYHDCLLYFKGFQALQTHRVAHWLYHSGRHALAFYLQSQVNQEFQIDIHPAAKFGEGVFIDHGTGIVVGETAVVGNDVSMLHRVTLGGSGVQNAARHPKIGNGVLIGAGACLLGNINVGAGTQIGAGSLVVEDLPERCVAVGVPAKVIGQSRRRKPALLMGQDFLKEVWHGSDI